MARILGKNTKPEIKVRQLLCSMGYRFRLCKKDLPGKPDIVLSKHKAVIFVNGCFWHLHRRCIDGKIPESRVKYWRPKLELNKKRDQLNARKLRRQGWMVLKLWECEVERDLNQIKVKITRFLKNADLK